MTTTSAPPDSPFPRLLRSWRKQRRLSQLELSLESGVSQRHLSFLESGRTRPSRGMILRLSEALEVPLRDRNDWLVAAGFAPAFRARALDDPQMAQVFRAVRAILDSHLPFPSVAVDRSWNVRLANSAFDLLAAMLGDDIWSRTGSSPAERNLLRLLFHPAGIEPLVRNWSCVAPLLWHRARREGESLGGEDLRALLDELGRQRGVQELAAAEETALVPVLPLELEKDGLRVSLFSVISTFGTAQDITADELRIESFFAADADTERFFRSAPA